MRQDAEPQLRQEIRHEPERLEMRPIGPPRRGAAVLGITIAIVLTLAVAGVAARLSVSLTGQEPMQRAATHPAPPPSPWPTPWPTVGPTVRSERHPLPAAGVPSTHFDPRTRQFLADGLQGSLPPSWFSHRQGYLSIGRGAGGCLGNRCRPDIAGQHPLEDNLPWGAEFEIVTVEFSLSGKDIDQTATKIINYWELYTLSSADTAGPVVVQHKRERTIRAYLPRPARMITADLHYRRPGMAVNYDHFYLVVVRGTTGGYTAYVAVWSDNAPTDAVRTIQDSINSLRVV